MPSDLFERRVKKMNRIIKSYKIRRNHAVNVQADQFLQRTMPIRPTPFQAQSAIWSLVGPESMRYEV